MATTGRGGTGPPAPALLARALGVPPQGPVHRAARVLFTVVTTGVALLLVLLAAASLSLVPGQLDDAGRQARAAARGLPGQAERTTAVDAARRSGERGLREAAGGGTASPDEDFAAVERWCASND